MHDPYQDAPQIPSPLDRTEFRYFYPIVDTQTRELLWEIEDEEYPLLRPNQRKMLEQANIEVLHHGIQQNLSLEFVEEVVGYGVFLRPDASPIRRGEVLGLYSGEYSLVDFNDVKVEESCYVFSLSEFLEIEPDIYEGYHGTLDGYDPDGDYCVICDAREVGCWTRFINHGGEQSNCVTFIASMYHPVAGRSVKDVVIVVKAERMIHPGQQLLFDYGTEYWEPIGDVPATMAADTYKLTANGEILVK